MAMAGLAAVHVEGFEVCLRWAVKLFHVGPRFSLGLRHEAESNVSLNVPEAPELYGDLAKHKWP